MAVAQKGAISFALVYIPVNLYTATQDNTIRFNQLSKETKGRVRYKKIDEVSGKELTTEDIVKGYEYDKGKYVVLTDEDFEKVKTEKDKSIQILQFSDLHEISPVFFDRSYYVTPQKGGEKAFELLRQAMEGRNRIAIGHTVIGANEVILALSPADDGLIMQTLHYADEVREIPRDIPQAKVDAAELKMADRIIASMEKPFEPAAFKNEYQERLRGLIEDKIEGREIAQPAAGGGNRVINLMDALKASMDELEGPAQKNGKARKTPARAKRRTGT